MDAERRRIADRGLSRRAVERRPEPSLEPRGDRILSGLASANPLPERFEIERGCLDYPSAPLRLENRIRDLPERRHRPVRPCFARRDGAGSREGYRA
jgi:hypothetical protein